VSDYHGNIGIYHDLIAVMLNKYSDFFTENKLSLLLNMVSDCLNFDNVGNKQCYIPYNLLILHAIILEKG